MTQNNILIKSTKFFVVLAILVGIVLFFQTTVDDSYICFRYGYNLIHHGIWNWNADNERIEAYTSFTYMILSVFPPLLNIQPQIFFKIFTFIFFLLILRRIYALVDNKKYNPARLRQFLLMNNHLSLEELNEKLVKEIADWQGSYEQTDDILLVGIQL